MFVHKETGAPAWLLQQDNDVLYSTVDPTEADHSRHHHGVTSYAFFSVYRDATPDELDAFAKAKAKPRAAPVVSVPMQRVQRTAPTVTPAATKPAAKKKAAKKKAAPKAAAKPDPKDVAPKDPPATDAADQANKEPPAAPGRQGGEPHGE